MKNINIKKIGVFLSIVSLLFLPQIGFAAGVWGGDIDVSQDLSIYLLRQLFGNVGGGVESGVSTILGQLFGVFNAGLISLTSLFMIYTITKSILATAAEGEAMGKHLTSWVPLRVALGVGLLVPKATGYSLLNVIVMWVVVQGVIFADVGWKTALDYLHNGGVLYVQATGNITEACKADPTKQECRTPEIIGPQSVEDAIITGDASQSKPGAKAGAVSIMRSSVCMHDIEYSMKNTEKNVKEDMVASNYAGYPNPKSTDVTEVQQSRSLFSLIESPTFIPYFDLDAHKVYFPGNMPEPHKDLKGVCGVYNWDFSPISHQNDVAVYFEAKKTGIQQMVDDIDPFVAHIYEVISSHPESFDFEDFSSRYASIASGVLLDAAADYQSVIYPARVQKVNNYNPRPPESGFEMKFYNDAVRFGWITAGRYYYEIMQLSGPQVAGVDNQFHQFQVSDVPPPYVDSTTNVPNSTFYALNTVGSKMFQSNMLGVDNVKGVWNSVWDKETPFRKKLLVWIDAKCVPIALKLADAIRTNIITGKGQIEVPEGMPVLKFESAKFGNAWMFDPVKGGRDAKDWIRSKAPFLPDSTTESGAHTIVWVPLTNALINIVNVWEHLFNQDPPNLAPPLVKIQTLGREVIGNCAQFYKDVWSNLGSYITGYYAASVATTGVLAIIGTATGGAFGFGLGVQNAINGVLHIFDLTWKLLVDFPVTMSLPMATALLTPMFAVGAIMAFYVPLIPFMLFTFGAIGWLMFVIEAMAAAPIVALGITHPEGHDLLGKSEQALMLLTSVFVRPITMILGLTIALILSYIALSVLNISYGYIMGSVLFGTNKDPAHGADVYRLIRDSAVLFLYPFIALPIINQSFSLIHIIPEKIMRWIGLHPEAGPEAQMLETVKSMVQSQAEQSARGASEGIQRAGRATGEFGPKPSSYTTAKNEGPAGEVQNKQE